MNLEPLASRRVFYRRWLWVFALSAVLVLLATLPPFLSPTSRLVVMMGFSHVCHQIPERSPELMGIQLAVCHRCIGIYAALPLAGLLMLGLRRLDRQLWQHARYIVPAFVAPMVLDWGLPFVGLWENTAASRMVTGSFFGLIAGIYLMLALVFRAGQSPNEDRFDSNHPPT